MTTTSAMLFLFLVVILTLAHKVFGNEGVIDSAIPDILQPRKWLGKIMGGFLPGGDQKQNRGPGLPFGDLINLFKGGMQKIQEQVGQMGPQRRGA